MASALAHAAVGLSIALPATTLPSVRHSCRHWPLVLLCIAAAVAPDLDVIFWHRVEYTSLFGHRGFFHAPVFLAVVSAAVALAIAGTNPKATGRTAWIVFLAIALSAISHPLLDAMTTGGEGVMLAWPWSEKRFFFAWRPIPVSPIGIKAFLSKRGVYILSRELWIILPIVSAGIGLYLIIKHYGRAPPTIE